MLIKTILGEMYRNTKSYYYMLNPEVESSSQVPFKPIGHYKYDIPFMAIMINEENLQTLN